MKCPSRDHSMVPTFMIGKEDEWESRPDGTQTCSFCGSMREADIRYMCEQVLEGSTEYEVEVAMGKDYKVYGRKRTTANAEQGAIKFYSRHANSHDTIDLINEAHRR